MGDQLAQHIRDRNAPILTMTTQPPVPGALFPWAMIWRADSNHPGLAALHRAIDELIATHDWLSKPDGAWLPDPEALAAY